MAAAILLSLCVWIPQRAMARQAQHDLSGSTWGLVSLTMSNHAATPDDQMKHTLMT